jgi:hypothetical protein
VNDPLTNPPPHPPGHIRGPAAIVSNGMHVFWMNQANGNLGRRPVTGGMNGANILNWGPAQSNQVGYLTLAAGKVYWLHSFTNLATVDGHVRRSNLDGTNIEVVANYPAPATNFDGYGGIAADATHVYWASQNTGVWRAPLNAANACVEQTGQPDSCTLIPGGSGAFGVAVDDTFVYWTEPGDPATPNSGTVKKAPKAGGASSFIASSQDNPRSIAVMDGVVYWGNQGPPVVPPTGSLRRAPQQAAPCVGNTCEIVAPVAGPEAVLAGPDGLYWTNRLSTGGGVYRLAK